MPRSALLAPSPGVVGDTELFGGVPGVGPLFGIIQGDHWIVCARFHADDDDSFDRYIFNDGEPGWQKLTVH